MAPHSALLASPERLQQATGGACLLLQNKWGTVQHPLESASTPSLLTRLSELLSGEGGDTAADHTLTAMDPDTLTAIVSVQRANINTQLAYPTALLLTRVAQSCAAAQQQQGPSSQQRVGALAASSSAAAGTLLKSWMSDIPDDLGLLVLLPALSRLGGWIFWCFG